jgi:hypothetical protein
MVILKLFMPLLAFNMVLPSCSNGWSVGNLLVTPADSVSNTVFIEIIAHDSTVHWYYGNIKDYNYCYKHEQYEEVKVK